MNLGRFIRFVAAGGTAAAVNFGSRILLSEVMPYVPAIIVAYCIGMTVAFLLNHLFVFINAENPVHQQLFWFVVVNLFAAAQTVLLSLLFARLIFPALHMTFHPETLAHLAGVMVPVITSYLGHKRLTFRSLPH